ncbi:MAG: T9SS type A sorting domain-containing protein [Saprospiraceae bacterium]
MKAFVLTILIVSFKSFAFSQSFFSVVPDFGGDEMEGRLYNVIPLQNEIKLIGIVHDSIVPGFDGGTWPILGTLSYDGEYLGSKYLTDSLYSDGFYYFTKRLVFKNDSICYLYDRRDLGASFLDAYLIELNFLNGKILRSKIITNNVTAIEDFFAEDIALDKNGNIYLVNVTTESTSYQQIITVLDSNLNLLSQTLIPNYGRKNFTKFTEIDEDGNIILIGVSLGAPNSVWFESKLFRQVLDKDFNSVEFDLATTNIDPSIVTSDTYSIIKSKQGDWICSTQLVKPVCQEGLWIPYLICLSNDFKEVKWETKMFDGNINSCNPFYFSYSITEVSDGYIFAGSSDGAFGIETSGILGKVGFNGDSLWLKHYIPIEWDTVQGRWFIFQDIKTTPIGNIVVGGEGSDRYTSSIRPWILHLDKDGCLEPGCNTTGISNDIDKLGVDLSIFPNPAIKNCSIHIHNQNSSSTGYELSIVNEEGNQMYKTHVLSGDVQYLIDLKEWQPGAYFVQLMDKTGAQLSKKFVVLK